MKYIKLFYKNGAIKELFEQETEKRIRAEYSDRKEKEILRNMLTDTDAAIAYIKRVNEIKTDIKTEIEAALGFSVDVGFNPETSSNGVADRVETLEATAAELNEALTMIIEGVTE